NHMIVKMCDEFEIYLQIGRERGIPSFMTRDHGNSPREKSPFGPSFAQPSCGFSMSSPSLPAVPPLAARAAFGRRLSDRDLFVSSPPVLSDLLGNGQDFGPELVRVFDLDPGAIAEDNDTVRWPHPELLLNQHEVAA